MGYISFFENFVQIMVLMIAWAIVLIAFFILAVQIFVTLIEFKLTTLAGFVLIPFALFNKTAFLAEGPRQHCRLRRQDSRARRDRRHRLPPVQRIHDRLLPVHRPSPTRWRLCSARCR